ncbi:hypothetical protein PF003_g3106 [Phytophthora fragariae]|nr:hypothetical protein PF003_g3106 [Phytophthora fragariae]
MPQREETRKAPGTQHGKPGNLPVQRKTLVVWHRRHVSTTGVPVLEPRTGNQTATESLLLVLGDASSPVQSACIQLPVQLHSS